MGCHLVIKNSSSIPHRGWIGKSAQRKGIMLATDSDVFALDVRVVRESAVDVDRPAACATDDGCASTCASSCVSNV